MDTGDLLDILPFRKKAELKAYFEAKGSEFCAKIENFAADFWEGYHNVAKEMLPNATRIGDRFHFMSQIQDALDTVLNYFKNRYTTARVEGTNNKLKMIKRKAFGFNNFENFRIKCLFECNYRPFTS